MSVRAEQTVASALLGKGVNKLGHSRKLAQARGVFCGNGRCQLSLIILTGLPK